MDPSAWMEYTSAAQQAYSHLRVPGNSQINTGSHPHHQYPHNRNLHQLNHMAAFNNAATATCQKQSANLAKSPKHGGQMLPTTNMNVSSHPSAGHHHHHQSMMNGHYNASSNGSPWFFNSRQQHANHDSSLQVRNHPERGNPSFNANPFGLHTPNGVYDSSFMTAQFQQHQSKSNYLPSMAASGFISNMKKPDADVNFRSNSNTSSPSSSYCPSMKGINMAGMSTHCSNSLRDTANLAASGPFFSSHSLTPTATGGWAAHHQNLISSNTANNGMLPHDTVNMITSQNTAPSTSIPRGYNRNSCASNPAASSLNGFCSKVSCNAKSSGGQNGTASSLNSSHSQGQYKNATATPFPNMPLSSNNSYLMQNFSSNRSGQNSFVDPSLGAKFAAAAAHHQVASDYASLAFAAAAMNSEYASSLQQQAQKHQQYMSSMNNFGANAINSNGHTADYHSMPFDHSTNFNANRHSNSFMNYCPTSLFPMAHSDASMNANLKSHHSSLLDDFNYTTVNANSHQQPNVNSAPPPNNSSQSNSNNKTTTSRKSASSQKRSQSYSKSDASVNSMNASFNEQFASSSTGCNGLVNGNSGTACMANGSSNVARSSVSRCSSVASTSNHQMQQCNDSYSYNYSPATTNISAHSPYQQRSSTSNSSHSSGASCAMSTGDYLNYGTPNPGPTVFPTIGTSQTPTPTPGYPTPPSSVGHSNSRCNSNEELSPYSSNSMSSSISQPYSRSDFKSSASSSSQISPKQMDTSISDSMQQFNSACMVASQKNSAISSESINQQQKHLLNAANMFDASNPLDDSYKSQQFSVAYPNHISSSAPASTCSNDLYLNYNSESASMSMNHQNSLVENGASAMDNANYDYHHYDQPANSQFDGRYPEKDELPSCAQQQVSKSTAHQSSAHMIESIDQPKAADYPNGPEHESFNLNFESVIQPIEVNLSEQHDQIQEQMARTNHGGDMSLSNLTEADKSTFPSIDDLNFAISHSEADNHCAMDGKHDTFALNQPMASSAEQLTPRGTTTIEHCNSIEYPSSHGNGHLLENTAMECNNIQSIIDSLPKSADDCLQSTKNDDPSELLSQCSTSDSFLSDLAPLMNDNSKIALMESTFKSNDISSVDKDLVIGSTPFAKINKDIFCEDNDLKMDHTAIEYAKHESEDNQLKDVDDFLENNLKDVQPSSAIDLLPKSNLDETIDSVARQGAQYDSIDEDAESETKLPLKSSKSSGSKKAESKKKDNSETPAGKNNNNSSNSSQSKFFKRKTSDSPLDGRSCKKRKVAVVMPKSKECKKPSGTSEYDFFEGAVKPKKSTKKQPPSEAKPNKRPVKVQLKKEESTLEVCTVTVKQINASESQTAKASNKKSVAEIAPSCGIVFASSPVKMDCRQDDKLVTSNKLASLTPVATSPNSLSEAKENVASINTSTVTKKSKNSNSHSSKSEKNTGEVTSKKGDKYKTVSNSKSSKSSSSSKRTSKSMTTTTSSSSSSKATSLPTIVSTANSSPLLPQAGLINATCLSKPVTSGNTFNLTPSTNATLSNVAPTLIMNPIENQPVSSYVSPVTNAVLISIHPANTTPISSLTAPSTFITLNTQNVTSSNNGNNTTTTTSCGPQSSSSRRRSQDKKVATVREGHMRTGDFVVSEEEAHLDLPVIWRIEGKSLLQRFEPAEQNGITVYTNTSSYSAWNPTVRQKYHGLDVRIMGCNRTRIVVEKIGLTQTKGSESSVTSVCEKDLNLSTSESPSPLDISKYIESFEVQIQTLISQALDSNFIAEIIKENDEYFLGHIQTIEDLCNKRRARFIPIAKWDTNIVKYIETYPEIQIQEQNNEGDLRCRLCHDNWSTKLLHFEGKMYNFDTLEPLPPQPESKQTKLASCELCTERTFLYSRVHHQKYNFLQKCKSKVDGIYSIDENKESHLVLEECIRDSDWIRTLFSDLESILVSCDNLR